VTDPVAMLTKARSIVDGLEDPELANWLACALSALENGDDPRPSLGLAAVDRQQFRLARRNRWLRMAYDQIDHSALPWSRCQKLTKHVIRYETIIAPRWQGRIEPPADASELRRALFYAAREGELPTSTRSLYRICCTH
jgi:hypothetical protein